MKFGAEKMDGEDKKSWTKKRSHPVGICFDSDDDEPIGSLFKLKRPRNVKKVKSELESGGEGDRKVEVKEVKLEVEGEDLGGMDDTLASFRKKLRGPKKDSGSGILRGRSSALNVVDSYDKSSNGLAEDGGQDENVISKVLEKCRVMGEDVSNNAIDPRVEDKCKERMKRPKINSKEKTADDHALVNTDLESLGSPCNSLRELECDLYTGEGLIQSVDEPLEDSLSAFVRKAQSGLVRKSRASSSLKQKRDSETLEGGFTPCSENVSGVSQPMTERRLRSESASTMDCNSLKSKNRISDDSFCQVADCIEENHDSTRRLPSDSANKLESMKPSNNGHDRSSKAIVEDPLLGSPCSISSSKGIQDEATEDPCGSNPQEGSKVDNDSLNEVSDGDHTHVQLKENSSTPGQKAAMGTRAFKDRLKPCSTVNMTTMVHDIVEIPNSICGSEKIEELNEFDQRKSSKGLIASLTQHSEVFPITQISNADLEISVTYCDEELLDKSSRYASNGICNNFSRNVLEVLPKCVSQNSSPSMKSGETCSADDGLNTCTEEPLLPSDSLQKKLVIVCEGQLSPHPITSNGSHKSGLASQMNEQEKFSDTCLEPKNPSKLKCTSTLQQNLLSDDALNGICVPSHDHLSVNEEGYETSPPSTSQDGNENYTEDATSVPDYESKDRTLSAVQRAVRKAKKHRHGDMAYEGDADWEILLNGRGSLESQSVADSERSLRTRTKCGTSSNIAAEAENGGAAAVSAGLKAHAAGPVEKIKFKEVLKRKGGLQEYLDCRLVNIFETWLYACRVVFLDVAM